jgi:hypothetical protein
MEYIGLGWRQQDGAWTAVRVTEAGMVAIDAAAADVDPAAAMTPADAAGRVLTLTEGNATRPAAADTAQEPGTAAITIRCPTG